MLTKKAIYQKVVSVLVEALNVDEDEIELTSTLQGDLGAESIDLLDIVFRLEREFAIKIPRGEIFPESVLYEYPECVENGVVTARGLARLRAEFPFADFSKFEKNPRLVAISDLTTAGMICRYIHAKLVGYKSGRIPEGDY